VRELLALARPLAVAPAADGTTNAVAARPPSALRPSYGPGSAARHGGLHVDLPRLAQDLDTPDDLASWRATLAV
jgi:2-phospho-L-lactate guanylyltransferase (CobY/MobA/RfbA family)